MNIIENNEEFKELAEIISKIPPIRPPDNFTPQVMTVITHCRTSFYGRVWNFLSQRRIFSLDPIRTLRGKSSNNELFIYYMMVASAHLAFAFVLLIGFQSVITKTLLPPIILLQPWLLLVMTCWLGLWGFLLKKKAAIGVRMARAATLIYIEVVVINGTLLIIEFKSIFFLLPFIAVIVGATIAAGIFLALICGADTVRMDKPENSCPGMKTPV